MLGLFLVLAVLGCGSPSRQDEQRPAEATPVPVVPSADADPDIKPALPALVSSGDALSDGVSLLRRGQVQEAIDLLEKAREEHPSDPAIAFYLGRAFNTDTKLARAEEAYRAALAIEPGMAEAWLRLSAIYVEQGRLAEALECLRSLGRERGRGPNLDYQEGFVLSKMGRFPEAMAMLQSSLKARPSPDAWYIYGVTAQRAGDDDQAVGAFQRALSLDPSYADAWFNLGNALSRQGRTKEAEDALRRFADLNVAKEEAASLASNLRVLRRGAEMDLQDGNLDRVEAQIVEAEAIDPGQPWVERLRGELLLAQGQREACLEHLRRSEALNARDPGEQMALARAFRMAGDPEVAKRHRHEAERLLKVGAGGMP
ncbi:MAG: tetratricopeptide repeat protein [Acidobacteria bacterium]|nr:tetratricopeptide repeat protein [Acidobacteriota bacterium]